MDIDAKVESFFQRVVSLLQTNIRIALTKLGEECIIRVRDRSATESWIDRTGNLRSSIGYAVYDEGEKVIESAFNTVGQGNDGSATGKKIIKELAQDYAKVTALVVIAGMNYADYVEALENKDVLESTRIWAEGIVQKRIENAVNKTSEIIENWEL